MKKRFITGIFIALVFATVVAVSLTVFPQIFDIFVLCLSIGAAIEMCRALSHKFPAPITTIAVLSAVIGYGAFFVSENYFSINGVAVFFAVVLVMFLVSAIFCAISKKHSFGNALTTLLAMCYPVFVLAFMHGLNYIGIDQNAYRAAAILLLFIVTPLTDVCAYLVGSKLKGPKLCPKISPNKTISGAIGGLIGGIIGGMLIFTFAQFGILSSLGVGHLGSPMISGVHYLLLGLFGSVMTQAGDLIASAVKRRVEIKDYGKLLPGHGGIMDRIDGMMLNAAFLYLYLSVICL